VISIDLNKAKEIWRDRLRNHRQPFFAQLDVDYLRALEAQNNVIKQDIETRKQKLRDAPADPRIEAATTPDVLRQINPVAEAMEISELEKAKLQKLQEIDNEWRQIIKTGWQTPAGWHLGLDIADVTLLSGAFMLAKEAAALGSAATTPIIDTAGVIHQLTLEEMTTLMLQYGQVRATLSAADATKRATVLNATDIQTISAV